MNEPADHLQMAVLVAALREGLKGKQDDPDGHVERLRALLAGERVRVATELGVEELTALRDEIVRDGLRAGMREALIASGVPVPIYNFFAGFDGNQEPWDTVPPTSRADSAPEWWILGRRIGAPIGVPASGLTANSSWVRYMAYSGWNLLTYRTVRSRSWPGHPFPHWLFVTDTPHISGHDALSGTKQIYASPSDWPKDLDDLTTVNNFGVPSPAPEVWAAEVEKSFGFLNHTNQMMIVSVMGGPEYCEDPESLASDYARVACMAADAGADTVELNLSCTNTWGGAISEGGLVCADPDLSELIVERCASELAGRAQIVLKLGYTPPGNLETLVTRTVRNIAGISAINTVHAVVQDPETNRPAFAGRVDSSDADREGGGVSGSAISDLALSTVRTLADIRRRLKADYTIIGIGGVASVDAAWAMHEAGADAVQSATGAAIHPGLALEYSSDLVSRAAEWRVHKSGLRPPHIVRSAASFLAGNPVVELLSARK